MITFCFLYVLHAFPTVLEAGFLHMLGCCSTKDFNQASPQCVAGQISDNELFSVIIIYQTVVWYLF